MKFLWEFQWMKKWVPLTEEIMDELLRSSMYNIALLKALLLRVQAEAIKKFPKEGITAEYIRNIADKRFAAIKALLLEGSEESERIALAKIADNLEDIKQDAKSERSKARLNLLKKRREREKEWGAGRYEQLERNVKAFGVSPGNLEKIIGRMKEQDPMLPKRDIAMIAVDVKQYVTAHKEDAVSAGRARKKEFDTAGEVVVREAMLDRIDELKKEHAV